MKYYSRIPLLALFLCPLVWAGDDDDKPVDPVDVLSELVLANTAKAIDRITPQVAKVAEAAAVAKQQGVLDDIATELVLAHKICKGNWGTMKAIVEALGECRSKNGVKLLKKLANQKKNKKPELIEQQGVALIALGKMADPKHIKVFEDMAKHRNVEVANASYLAMKAYGPAPGKVRKKMATMLMKRLGAEVPPTSGNVSQETRDRYAKVKDAIIGSLKAICREETINDAPNWIEWWKENKKIASVWKDPKEG